MCIKTVMSTFETARVNDALHGTLFHGRLHHFTAIDSTNTRALADAQAGAEAGQVYIADEQTAGRGRGGHTWHSEPDRGLYLSVLVRPSLQSNDALKLSFAAAIAASHAIRQVTGFAIDLRWPNDLVAPTADGISRKLGGILTESASAPDGHIRHAVIGIGINLNQVEFPAELERSATSLRLAAATPISREAVAIALLQHLDQELSLLAAEDTVFARFTTLSAWVQGKRVHVAEGEGYTGMTAGLTEAGLLRIHCDDGTERVVRHGGVREEESHKTTSREL
jgi:BirA family biotin operon repressor/biotin-[acetyl-CoA-carboxylase] ligase